MKKKNNRRSYIFTNKKHSLRAIMSVILGAISLISLGIVVYLTCRKGGEAAQGYGVTGLLAALFSVTGLVLGILTLGERTAYRLFPWLGLALNGISLAVVSFLLYLGSLV